MRKWVLLVVVLAAAGCVAAFLLLRQGSKATPAAAPATVEKQLAPGVLPRAGVYRYAQSGYEEAKLGPLKIHRSFPKTGLLVVSGSGNLVQEEWRYSKQHLEATRNRVTPTGTYTTWERTRLQIIITQDQADRTKPAPLDLPATLHVGQRWTEDYTVNGIRSVSRNVVTRGCGAGCFVIVANSTVTGAHPGTERDVTWQSTKTGLPLRETIDRRIGGSFPYRMLLTVRLLPTGRS